MPLLQRQRSLRYRRQWAERNRGHFPGANSGHEFRQHGSSEYRKSEHHGQLSGHLHFRRTNCAGGNAPGCLVTVLVTYVYDPFTVLPLGVTLSSTSQGIITF